MSFFKAIDKDGDILLMGDAHLGNAKSLYLELGTKYFYISERIANKMKEYFDDFFGEKENHQIVESLCRENLNLRKQIKDAEELRVKNEAILDRLRKENYKLNENNRMASLAGLTFKNKSEELQKELNRMRYVNGDLEIRLDTIKDVSSR